MNSILQSLPQWLQVAVLILGFLSAAATLLSALLAALSPLFPGSTALAKASSAVTTFGVDVQKVLAFLGDLVGKQGGKATGLVLFLGIGATALMSGCALVTPKRINAVAEITNCVLTHRDLPPENIAMVCGIEDAKDVVDIITGEDRRIAAAHVAACK